MKRITPYITLIACITLASVMLQAQSTSSSDAPERIAVLNIQEAISETDAGKQALAELRKKYAPRQQDLQQQEKDITALQDKLQNQGAMLSDQERYDLTQELNRKQRRFKEATDDAQADYTDDTQAAVHDIGQKMVKLISQYAPAHHFALVLGDQQIPIYYASKAVDITQDLVALYNRTYPLTQASAAKPAK